jgi:hypothetical protein
MDCAEAQDILDWLLYDLVAQGEDAPEEEKIRQFKGAVEALNKLHWKTGRWLIETEQREQLCHLSNHIAVKAGIDPTKYGDGEGMATEWRDW